MKFWSVVLLFVSLVVFFGIDSSNSLGNKIASNISKISERNFRDAIENKKDIMFVTADDYEVLTHASITPIDESTKEAVSEVVLNEQVLFVFLKILNDIPPQCEKTNQQLNIRYKHAVGEENLDFEKLARWVDFAGRTCRGFRSASFLIGKYKGLYDEPLS